MTISNQQVALLQSLLTAQTTREQIGVAVLKKAQDATRQQGEAFVEMLEKSVSPPLREGLDVYA